MIMQGCANPRLPCIAEPAGCRIGLFPIWIEG
jgi:hypothetical protein